MISLLSLEPATYRASALHGPGRTFRETNCYADIWIELLHARSIDPASVLSSACFSDFETDQWTFFKPAPEVLRSFYGIDVHEIQIYRPLTDHIAQYLTEGHTVIVEADAYFLPDTAGTSYRRNRVKSSVAVEAIDREGERLRYFHGAGYHELSGEDYRGVFRTPEMPPYLELVRFDRGARIAGAALRERARAVLAAQWANRPTCNPWLAFGERLTGDLPGLLAEDAEHYHAYAFATVRQCGAAYELAHAFLEWFAPVPDTDAREALAAFAEQVDGSKALLFKLARRKAFSPAPLLATLAGAWESAMTSLGRIAGSRGSAL